MRTYFVIDLQILINKKRESYDFVVVIVDRFTKMVYCKLGKIRIDVVSLAKIIIDMVIKHHGLFGSIISD